MRRKSPLKKTKNYIATHAYIKVTIILIKLHIKCTDFQTINSLK